MIVRSLAELAAATVLICGEAAGDAAQERPGAIYIHGGVTVGHQDGAADGAFQIDITAPGGTAVGWAVAGGVFVARRVSIEGEWSWAGMLTAREPARYGMTYVEERRDRSLGALVRFHVTPGSRVDVGPVAGAEAMAHDRWSTTETTRPWLPPGEALEVGPRIHYDTVTGPPSWAASTCGSAAAGLPSFRGFGCARSAGARTSWPTILGAFRAG